MTEEDWLSCAEPQAMLDFLAPSYRDLSARKLRLFAAYCCRNLLSGDNDPVLRHAVDLAERYAEGEASGADLWSTINPVYDLAWYEGFTNLITAASVLNLIEHVNVQPLRSAQSSSANGITAATLRFGPGNPPILEAVLHAKWLRDIFPSPYRPKHISREWFKGNDRTAEILARGIYEDRAFERLPILADALQEAGCENEDILNHCREPGEHIRGCWVVDLVLGKV